MTRWLMTGAIVYMATLVVIEIFVQGKPQWLRAAFAVPVIVVVSVFVGDQWKRR